MSSDRPSVREAATAVKPPSATARARRDKLQPAGPRGLRFSDDPLAHVTPAFAEAKRRALEFDWRVFPCYRNGTPYQSGWTQYRDRRPAVEELDSWAEAPVFGLVTGTPSGVIVLDFDRKDGKDGFAAWADLGLDELPITPTARTPHGGGQQLYFRAPVGVIVGSRIGLFSEKLGRPSGIDFLAEMYSTRLPGAPGREWEDGLSPDDVPLADLPQWLLDAVSEELASKARPAPSGGAAEEAGRGDEAMYAYIASSGKLTLPSGAACGATLAGLMKDRVVIEALAEYLGIPDTSGRAFRCILPSHRAQSGDPERRPSASVTQGANGVFVYRDWHNGAYFNEQEEAGSRRRTCPPALTFGAVYAAKVSGTARELEAHEQVMWSARLLLEAGLAEWPPVPMPPLPSALPPQCTISRESVEKVYAGIRALFAVRRLYFGEDSPAMLAWRFVGGWTGTSANTAQKALAVLARLGVVHIAGHAMIRGHQAALFSPGPLPGKTHRAAGAQEFGAASTTAGGGAPAPEGEATNQRTNSPPSSPPLPSAAVGDGTGPAAPQEAPPVEAPAPPALPASAELGSTNVCPEGTDHNQWLTARKAYLRAQAVAMMATATTEV